jgi:propanol-preferring alcohol dehydrogenase
VAGRGEILVRVLTCGVCRTDLHVVDGDLPEPTIPVIPGHEIVGRVERGGDNVKTFAPGERVGIPWLGRSCGECEFCRGGREHLCRRARYTGIRSTAATPNTRSRTLASVFAFQPSTTTRTPRRFFAPARLGTARIEWLVPARDSASTGLVLRPHVITQVAVHQERDVYAFVAPGDEQALRFAREVGATWAGPSNEKPPVPLDSALIFAPVGHLVPEALSGTTPGGSRVCRYSHERHSIVPLSIAVEERILRSVANLTRRDAEEFLALASDIPLRMHVQAYPLADANEALSDLRAGRLSRAAFWCRESAFRQGMTGKYIKYRSRSRLTEIRRTRRP